MFEKVSSAIYLIFIHSGLPGWYGGRCLKKCPRPFTCGFLCILIHSGPPRWSGGRNSAKFTKHIVTMGCCFIFIVDISPVTSMAGPPHNRYRCHSHVAGNGCGAQRPGWNVLSRAASSFHRGYVVGNEYGGYTPQPFDYHMSCMVNWTAWCRRTLRSNGLSWRPWSLAVSFVSIGSRD